MSSSPSPSPRRKPRRSSSPRPTRPCGTAWSTPVTAPRPAPARHPSRCSCRRRGDRYEPGVCEQSESAVDVLGLQRRHRCESLGCTTEAPCGGPAGYLQRRHRAGGPLPRGVPQGRHELAPHPAAGGCAHRVAGCRPRRPGGDDGDRPPAPCPDPPGIAEDHHHADPGGHAHLHDRGSILRSQRTISELINEEDMEEVFPEYLMEHSSGYQVLSAPADPFAAELVGPREATRVLECARGQFDYIVVDTPPSLNEVVLAAFDQSRYLVVMATLDVPSLRNLRVFLETIDRLKLPAEDISCVLNKAEPDNGIDLQELLRVYPRGFAAVLPYSKEVSRSLNIGQPVLTGDPRAEISQKLLEAGAKLVPAADVINPTWGARPPGRASWRGRRKERQAQMQTNRASPPRPAGHPRAARKHPAPAASTSAAL